MEEPAEEIRVPLPVAYPDLLEAWVHLVLPMPLELFLVLAPPAEAVDQEVLVLVLA